MDIGASEIIIIVLIIAILFGVTWAWRKSKQSKNTGGGTNTSNTGKTGGA